MLLWHKWRHQLREVSDVHIMAGNMYPLVFIDLNGVWPYFSIEKTLIMIWKQNCATFFKNRIIHEKSFHLTFKCWSKLVNTFRYWLTGLSNILNVTYFAWEQVNNIWHCTINIRTYIKRLIRSFANETSITIMQEQWEHLGLLHLVEDPVLCFFY